MQPTFRQFWDGKRVLLTGHTGFKGAWLAHWLTRLGAHVTGLALAPETSPALFDQLGLMDRIDHRIGDIRDASLVRDIVKSTQPDIVLHLAAQALVLRSYREPIDNWATNVMGTANLLDALRGLDRLCAAVVVTTDKVYRNNEWDYGYRETDTLGGHDPYSASKAAAELVVENWRKSFFEPIGNIRVASARAGNVIGGGDWSENRIVPDIARSLAAGALVSLRRPQASRPWQHVLEPLGGYLLLAQHLCEHADPVYQSAFNFGPNTGSERTVRELLEESLRHWNGDWRDDSDPAAPHEAGRLALSIERARTVLGWTPHWDFEETVERTILWYRAAARTSGVTVPELVDADIAAYEASACG